MTCRLCNSHKLHLYYTQGTNNQFRFYKCSKCSLVNLDIEGLNTVSNQQKYAEEYKDPCSDKLNRGAVNTYSFIKKRIKQKGKYLDIGCGNGALLLKAQNDGWQVHGLELSQFLSENIKKNLNISVDVANFLEYSSSNSKYDLVSLRHVLEHLPDSKLAMQKINGLLTKNGVAVLEFPNIEGASFKIKRFLSKIGVYKKKYKEDYVPGHCNEFSKKSFQYLVHKTGFELLCWETYSSKNAVNILFKIFNAGIKARVLIKKKNY